MLENNKPVIVSGGFETFTESGGFEDIYKSYDSGVLAYFYDQAQVLIEELDINTKNTRFSL